MKNRIKLQIAVVAGCLSARACRAFSRPDCVVLGNAADKPEDAAELAPEIKPQAAVKELAQRTVDDVEIKKMTASGLTHEQATAAVKHKKEFSAGFKKWEKDRVTKE